MTDQILRDATCAGCGCACDDIDLTVRDGRIAVAERACPLGEAWFAVDAPADAPACLVAGRPASLQQALDRAAEILTAARYPLVYGLTQTSCEAAQLAVGIADWIGGVVDTPGGVKGAIGGGSFPSGGEVTCSLGEIANRADLVLVWRANPVVTHPRHFSRYSLEPRGRFVPGGRADRTLIVVDSRQTETAAAADRFVSLRAEADFEALWVLRALVRGNPLRPADVLAATGLPLERWQELADWLKQARFAVFLFDHQLPAGRAGHVTADALWCLVRDLNAHTRAAATVLTAHGNSAGAAGVISWRCGAPAAVNLARGYPRFDPSAYSAERILARGEADAALLVASDPASSLSPAACAHLARIDRVVIGPAATIADPQAAVALTTAAVGRSAPGTIFRADGVPLPLRPALTARHPSDVAILTRLEARVKERAAAGRSLPGGR